MPRLVIEIYGSEYEIVCGQISKRAKDDLVKYCNEHNKSIEDVFYCEDEIMKKIYGDDALPVCRLYGQDYRLNNPLPYDHIKVMHHIQICRTAALGGHLGSKREEKLS